MDVKKAVEAAKNELVSLMGKEEVSDIRLEEVEMQFSSNGESRDTWKITFSYLPKEIDPILSLIQQRIYKTIIVDDEGNFVSMKIRELAKA